MTKLWERLKDLLIAFLKKCFFLLRWVWIRVQCIAQILMPLRFSIVTIFLVALLFSWSAPGKDLLMSLIDKGNLWDREVVLFFMALLIWALCLWYWSRVMMRFIHDDFLDSKDDTEEDSQWKAQMLGWFRKYVPRLMGLIPFIILFVAFYKGSQNSISQLCWVSLGLGALYYLIVHSRTRIMFWNEDTHKIKSHYAPQHKDWRDIGKASIISLFATLGMSTIIFIIVWVDPQLTTSLGMGTGSVLFLASASWVAFGSTMVSLSKGFKFPIISVALVGAVIIGPSTDNHQVRNLTWDHRPTLTDGYKGWLGTLSGLFNKEAKFDEENIHSEAAHLTWDQRPTVEEDFREWMATRSELFNKETELDEEKIHPIYIIAAEGGGIRAAYWTANLLAAFQDANPNFSDHVYALSGISGGSLGVALFVSLLKHQEHLNCDAQGFVEESKKNRSCAHAILSEDFLTPTVASMLYPDLIQRLNFLSFIGKFPDRAKALETTFEKAWKDHMNEDNRFSRSFLESWDARKTGKNPSQRLPSLFLNSTWVEGGKRVITSNVQIRKEDFPDAEDLFSIMCSEIRLSTAVHNSARFSYVSPAGTVEEPILKDKAPDGEPCRRRLENNLYNLENSKGDKEKEIENIKQLVMAEDVTHKVWGHIVDGGYFENSGNTTVFDILSTIGEEMIGDADSKYGEYTCGPEDQPKLQFRCYPVVITLINDPVLEDASKADPDRWLKETLSPLKTLFQTRDGRGSYARESTKRYVQERLGGRYFEFSLHGENGILPLSWVLSERVMENIQSQVDEVLPIFLALQGERAG